MEQISCATRQKLGLRMFVQLPFFLILNDVAVSSKQHVLQ